MRRVVATVLVVVVVVVVTVVVVAAVVVVLVEEVVGLVVRQTSNLVTDPASCTKNAAKSPSASSAVVYLYRRQRARLMM